MVTPVKHLSILAMGVFVLALPAQARAQADAPQADASRVAVTATGGITTNDQPGATYGGELTIRLSRIFDLTIGAAHLSDITADDFTAGADMIAGLVGATADARAFANVFEAGVRLRWPTGGALRPYAVIGGGVARITAEATFFRNGVETDPAALGIGLGPNLSGEVTRGLGMIGAGVDVAASKHLAIDAGIRYTGFVATSDGTPRYYVYPVLRAQFGIGVRF